MRRRGRGCYPADDLTDGEILLPLARTTELAGFRDLQTAAVPEDNNMYQEGKRRVRVCRIDLQYPFNAES